MRDLTIEGKIPIFKTLPISKIVDLASIANALVCNIEQLNIIKKNFIWQGKNKVKHSTLRFTNTCELGGLECTDKVMKRGSH